MNSQNQPLIDRETSIETLNALMRGELAAVETYRHANSRLGTERQRTSPPVCNRMTSAPR